MLRREPFFKQTPDPCCQSLGFWGSPVVVAQSLCMLSVIQTGNLDLCSCGPRLLSHIMSLRTLWNLNCTCISFPSNNDQHYFSEQTVKGALERLGGVGWTGGSSIHQGSPCPSRSSWWYPHIFSCELSSARAGLCIERIVATMQLKPPVAAITLTFGWPPEPSGFASVLTSGTSSCRLLSRSQWKALPCQPGFRADLANSVAALSPKWEYWFCVRDLF